MVLVEQSSPDEVKAHERRLADVTIGALQPLSEPIALSDYQPTWPEAYWRHATRIRSALGLRALRLEHVGSTSVPGLPAKPIIDIALEVRDSSDEPSYVPDLEAAGYVLRIREPDWFEHRMFRDLALAVNLHVFSTGCSEKGRMVRFRDWLKGNASDRDLYARAKRELASRDWTYMQQYADAKSDVIASIMARAEATSTVSDSTS
jgi:GrpB-like predicted nucleotidyltransferase (UPF0157 family)